ncbi:MAG: Ig-like domain-containing protein [Balneolaceae bacterium]|nr:Ig-like domain-containing protein [Balneolaceae bacterium]MBO6546430.1 Ig-like domain-containing protein [Balneolaceae bacterium]MBO6648789.1 Ig-like domain-containing protein [Balneolaceae bacterium]
MYVKKNPLLYHILVLVVALVFLSCATPSSPSGGPSDQAGPEILETKPASGTTNFKGNKFEFQFSEFVNRSSIPNNITVEPDLGLEYKIKWKRKRLSIEFQDRLPDSTTVILTLGADITDTKQNKIGAPITLAVSTGDEIDQGRLTGRLRIADTGEGAEGAKVLLYRSPIDLSEKAIYQAQADTGGIFNFSYLREGNYQALYVDDRNRNKIWDQGSEAAQPFSRQIIELEKAGSDTLDVLYIVQQDSLAPKLQGVGLFSSKRMRLRFNENIELQDNATLTVLDSLGNTYSEAYPLYISQKDPFVLFAQSEKDLGENDKYSLSLEGITDEFGNTSITDGIAFEGSTQVDTTLQRVIEHRTGNGIFPSQRVEVMYAAPINDPMLIDSIVVVEGNVSFSDWPAIYTERNFLFIEPQEETWIEGVDYQFLIWNPATQRRQLLEPEIWDSPELGELALSITGEDSISTISFSLINENIDFKIDSSFTTSIILQNLAPINYQLIVFKDENGNNRWDSGSVIPFQAPEPYYLQRNINVRSGFTSEIFIEF